MDNCSDKFSLQEGEKQAEQLVQNNPPLCYVYLLLTNFQAYGLWASGTQNMFGGVSVEGTRR